MGLGPGSAEAGSTRHSWLGELVLPDGAPTVLQRARQVDTMPFIPRKGSG